MPVDLVLVRHGQSEGNLYDEIDLQGLQPGKQEEADRLKRKLHGKCSPHTLHPSRLPSDDFLAM